MASSSRFVRYAPKSARFLLTVLSDHLPRARRLVVSAPLQADDGGEGGDYTLSVDEATSQDAGVVKLTGQLGGLASSPDVRGLRTPDGGGGNPALLAMGALGDGQVLAREGSALVGKDVLPTSGGTMQGDLDMGDHKITGLQSGTDPDNAATYGQLTAMLNGLDWQNSVLSVLDEPPGSPELNDRYLVSPTPTASTPFEGHADEIAQWEGQGWMFVEPNKGFTVHIEAVGKDVWYSGTQWKDMGASIDHASLLNLGTGNPHTQYQQVSEKDATGGYAGIGNDGLVNPPARSVNAGADPDTPNPGAIWVNGGALKFRDNQGSPATQFVELQSNKNQSNGYAGLDANGNLMPPAKKLRISGDPDPVNPGDIWVVGSELKYRDNDGTPSTHFVEYVERKGQANGYAGLDNNGKVAQSPKLHAASHAAGQADAISPADINAVPTGRQVSAGTGLTGGGDLTQDRTLSIAAFTGIVSKDVDPTQATWSDSEVKVHLAIDVGTEGVLVPTAVRLPACVNDDLETEVVFEFHDASTAVLANAATAAVLDENMQGLANILAGPVGQSALNNGKAVRKIKLQTRNTTSNTVTDIDIGEFNIRAIAMPRGGGNSL